MGHHIKPGAETMTYCYASNMPSVSRPSSKKNVIDDELFMFLVRIGPGLLQQDLAHKYNVSKCTVELL